MFKIYTGTSGILGPAGETIRKEIRDLHECEYVQQELTEIAENVKQFKITHKPTKYTDIGAFNGSKTIIPKGTKIGWYVGRIRLIKSFPTRSLICSLYQQGCCFVRSTRSLSMEIAKKSSRMSTTSVGLTIPASQIAGLRKSEDQANSCMLSQLPRSLFVLVKN